MHIYHRPIRDGYGRVVTCWDKARMLTPAPSGDYIEIDPDLNSPLYYDIITTPNRYLVSESGDLFVDEDWGADEAV